MPQLNDQGNELAVKVAELVITLSTGSIVFSVSLLPEGTVPKSEIWLLLSWSTHLIAVLLGITFLIFMIGFYYHTDLKLFKKRLMGMALVPFAIFFTETLLFLLGLVFLAIFALNLGVLECGLTG